MGSKIPQPPGKRTLQQLGEEALDYLRARNCPIGCGGIGEKLFLHKKYHLGTAPYARIAGRVMKRLQNNGLVTKTSRGGWILTEKGKNHGK